MKLRFITIGLVFIVGVLSLPAVAFAALDVISLRTKPEIASPREEVTVSLQSYAVDLSSANITWYVDKEVVQNGVGAKSLKTVMKDFGEPVTVDIVIITLAGGRYDKQLVLSPAEVDILWEADTSVPPFYKGKALPTYRSSVTMTAIPRFTLEPRDPASFNYTWTMNGTQGLGGGMGKNTAIIPMSYAGVAIPVSVRVSNGVGVSGGGTAYGSVKAVEPFLAFYEQAPLLGARFNTILPRNIKTEGTSFRVRATPYFFSLDDIKNENILYKWKKDSVVTPTPLNPNMLLIGKNGKDAQSSIVELTIQNKKRILQSAQNSVAISFPVEK